MTPATSAQLKRVGLHLLKKSPNRVQSSTTKSTVEIRNTDPSKTIPINSIAPPTAPVFWCPRVRAKKKTAQRIAPIPMTPLRGKRCFSAGIDLARHKTYTSITVYAVVRTMPNMSYPPKPREPTQGNSNVFVGYIGFHRPYSGSFWVRLAS